LRRLLLGRQFDHSQGLHGIFLYPRKATIRTISDNVIVVSIPKTGGFNYNPGQYIYICVPELGLFQWQPFSLSSSPEQKVVTIHIRTGGNRTRALCELARKKKEIDIILEGPYGVVGVDIMSDRYKMVMLVSDGIGVTPMQSLCNELYYEKSINLRELKKLSFIWVERDPYFVPEVDVVRNSAAAPSGCQHQEHSSCLLVDDLVVSKYEHGVAVEPRQQVLSSLLKEEGVMWDLASVLLLLSTDRCQATVGRVLNSRELCYGNIEQHAVLNSCDQDDTITAGCGDGRVSINMKYVETGEETTPSANATYSDSEVSFDFHYEVFD
jgi:hypothetical protein